MQNPFHQLQKLDISALSSFDEFSNVMNLLSKVDNPEFVKQIEQKLKDNLAFREFQKEREREISPRLAEAGSRRLAELVAQKRQAAQRSERVQAGQNNLIFANYQMMSAVFSELLATQGMAGLNQGYLAALNQVDFRSLEQGLQQVAQVEVATQNAILTAKETPKPLNQEGKAERKKVQDATLANATQAGATSKQLAEMQVRFAFTNFMQDYPAEARLLFDPKKRDGNGFPMLKKNAHIDDFLKFRQAMDKVFGDKPDAKTLERLTLNYGNKAMEKWQQQKAAYEHYISEYSFENMQSMFKALAQKAAEQNKPFVVSVKSFNQAMDMVINDAFRLADKQGHQLTIEKAEQQLKGIKTALDDKAENFNVLNMQFEQFGLYYANAQKVMASKGWDFATFLQSKEGNKFGLARQVLSSSIIQQAAKLEPNDAIRLMSALGIDDTMATIALQAYREIENDPQALQWLERKQGKDYRGGSLGVIDLNGKAEYQFTSDGVELKLDPKQQRELAELQESNPDWRKDVAGLVKSNNLELEEQKVVENKEKNNLNSLDEDISYQVNKVEIALFATETTKTFNNNQQIKHTEEVSQHYKPSI